MNMTIADVLEMFCFPNDQKFNVVDLNDVETIFVGFIDECPDEILEMDFENIDNIYNGNDVSNGITFNVWAEI